MRLRFLPYPPTRCYRGKHASHRHDNVSFYFFMIFFTATNTGGIFDGPNNAIHFRIQLDSITHRDHNRLRSRYLAVFSLTMFFSLRFSLDRFRHRLRKTRLFVISYVSNKRHTRIYTIRFRSTLDFYRLQ